MKRKINYIIFFFVIFLSTSIYNNLNKSKPTFSESKTDSTTVTTEVISKPNGEVIKRKITTSSKNTTKQRYDQNKKRWTLSVKSSLNTSTPIYTIEVQRDLFLGFSVGIYARSDKELGASLSISF